MVGATPIPAPISGPLAQSSQSARLSSGGSREQSPHGPPVPGARSVRRQHGCFANSRRRSVTVRVHHFIFPGDPAVGCRSVKAEALVRPQPGEPLQPQPPARCNGTLHTPLLTVEVPGSNPGAGAIYQRSTSGIDEETVSKTAAPRKGVQSAILWCSATSFHPSVAQQQSTRPISERPWSVTTPRDQTLDGSDR